MYQTNRIQLYGRKKIHEILGQHRSACFMTHQWNNDYNYMTLELMYCHYPILHNSIGWKEHGYSYSIDQWEDAIDTLHRALTRHLENMSQYQSDVAQLIQRHSIHDATICSRWKTILE